MNNINNNTIVRIFEQAKHDNTNVLLDFLINLIELCEDMDTVMTAILMLDKVNAVQNMTLHREHKDLLKEALKRHSMFVDHFDVLNVDSFVNFDSLQYQVDWCANWCVDNLLSGLPQEAPSDIKLSSDRLSARNDSGFVPSVLSSYAVTGSGVYYYEVILITNGKMRFGWATWEARLNKWNAIGEDRHSIGYDGWEDCVWHYCSCANVKHRIGQSIRIEDKQTGDTQIVDELEERQIEEKQIDEGAHWNIGDVVGCLIDLNCHQFVFYLNGKQICHQVHANFSSQPYHAAASLSTHQQAQFNFGQCPFKFSPDNIQYKTFHKETNENISQYRLMETCLIKEYNPLCYYWFKRENNNNGKDSKSNHVINLFFRDKAQQKYDKMIVQLESDIYNYKTSSIELDQIDTLRFIQSLIEVLHIKLKDDNTEIIIKWIKQLLMRNEHNSFEHVKLCELLYPYIQLPATSANLVKCHNTLVIIAEFFKVNEHFQNVLSNSKQNCTLKQFIKVK